MTRLFFLPDDQTLVVLDSPLAAGALVEWVNQGRWTPPAPYDTRHGDQIAATLHAIRLGSQTSTVIITPHPPFDLAEPALAEIHRLLKPRQRQILLLLAHGLSNKEIAIQLGLHPRTVAQHIAALKVLFGASSRAQSILKAVDLGFFEE
jgi:DNA-binding NarL/FixJ family response regulator